MEWYHDIIEEFTQDMTEFGLCIDNNDVQFSGFWSQGDGASFIVASCDVDLHKFLSSMLGFREVPEHLLELKQKINWNFGWSHDGVELGAEEYHVLRNLMGIAGEENKYMLLAKHCIIGHVDRISHQHCHENSISAELEPDWRVFTSEDDVDAEELIEDQWIDECNVKEYYKFIDALQESFEKFVKDACCYLYRRLEEEYEVYSQEEEEIED